MNHLQRKIYGDEYADRMEKFEADLLKIEVEHKNWFNERVNEFTDKKPDRLENHWMIVENLPRVSFRFNNDSELPQEIREKCLLAFDIFVNPVKAV